MKKVPIKYIFRTTIPYIFHINFIPTKTIKKQDFLQIKFLLKKKELK